MKSSYTGLLELVLHTGLFHQKQEYNITCKCCVEWHSEMSDVLGKYIQWSRVSRAEYVLCMHIIQKAWVQTTITLNTLGVVYSGQFKQINRQVNK